MPEGPPDVRGVRLAKLTAEEQATAEAKSIDALYKARDEGRDMHAAGREAAQAVLRSLGFKLGDTE